MDIVINALLISTVYVLGLLTMPAVVIVGTLIGMAFHIFIASLFV